MSAHFSSLVDFYASDELRLTGGGDVEVLARFEDRAELDAAMRGFAHVCGLPQSAAWLRSRAALARFELPGAC
jgi:hypothetical protein